MNNSSKAICIRDYTFETVATHIPTGEQVTKLWSIKKGTKGRVYDEGNRLMISLEKPILNGNSASSHYFSKLHRVFCKNLDELKSNWVIAE